MKYQSSKKTIRSRMERKFSWNGEVTHVHRLPLRRHIVLGILSRVNNGVADVDTDVCIVHEDSKYPMKGDIVDIYKQKEDPSSHLIVAIQED
jgi:hypothetical protein